MYLGSHTSLFKLSEEKFAFTIGSKSKLAGELFCHTLDSEEEEDDDNGDNDDKEEEKQCGRPKEASKIRSPVLTKRTLSTPSAHTFSLRKQLRGVVKLAQTPVIPS